jgi:hypothetical protein
MRNELEAVALNAYPDCQNYFVVVVPVNRVNQEPKQWRMERSEVTYTASHFSSTSTKKGPTRRSARARKSLRMTLKHKPTGIEVSGEVPDVGGYTRKELAERRDELWRRLWNELESLVARRLRVPGR